jgi:hypothetical protein
VPHLRGLRSVARVVVSQPPYTADRLNCRSGGNGMSYVLREIVRPPEVEGGLEDLADFVEAHVLPHPDIVGRFHAALLEYCKSADPLFVIRAPSRARHQRGCFRRTGDGCRVRFSDNAPAWQVHHTLFHGEEAAFARMAEYVASLPTHFFEVTKRLRRSVNSAGWYVAHILPVGDRRAFDAWRRADLMRRFVRNIHPCNVFYVPKRQGRERGEDPQVIRYFAERLQKLYAATWIDFLRVAGEDEALCVSSGYPAPAPSPSIARLRRAPVQPSRVHATSGSTAAVTRYSFSRLCFKRDVIEPLSEDARFEVVTPVGVFRMTKRQFHDDFPALLHTVSYRDRGIYHFPQVPHRALKYLVTP